MEGVYSISQANKEANKRRWQDPEFRKKLKGKVGIYTRTKGIREKGSKSLNGKYREEKSPNWVEKIKFICDCGCGREKLVTPKEFNGTKNHFFNQKCWGRWISKNKSGPSSPSYRGGLTSIKDQVRGSDKYIKWRTEVFIRDHFTCQICKEVGGELHAHHIKPFKILFKEALKYLPLLDPFDACMQYTPLWDINNGLTLCKRCHKDKKNKLLYPHFFLRYPNS